MQRATAAHEDQNDSKCHEINKSTTSDQLFYLDSTVTLNIVVCSSNVNKLKKALERERKSNECLPCTGELWRLECARLRKKLEVALIRAEIVSPQLSLGTTAKSFSKGKDILMGVLSK